MDKGIMNITLLEKNIKQIEFYSKEEQNLLNKIYQKLEEDSNNYHSSNTSLFLNDITNSKENITKIAEKRAKYTAVLNRAINQYNTLANNTKNRFNNGADKV